MFCVTLRFCLYLACACVWGVRCCICFGGFGVSIWVVRFVVSFLVLACVACGCDLLFGFLCCLVGCGLW